MDKRQHRYQQAKSVIVNLRQWHGNEECEECEDSSQSGDNSLLLGPSWINVKNYLTNGVILLDIEESDLQTITIRVMEQMVDDGVVEKFDIKNVSNMFLLMQHSTLKKSSGESEEHKSNGISRKDSETIDMQKLIGGNDSNSVNCQSESYHLLSETALVMVGNTEFIRTPTLSFVRLSNPVYFPETNDYDNPVRCLFILLGPTQDSLNYLEIGSSICTALSDEKFCFEAYGAKTKDDLFRAVERVYAIRRVEFEKYNEQEYSEEEHSNLLDDADQSSSNPLLKTNRLWGGLINDVSRRLPQYKSDILDGLNRQVLAASIFLYFGVLSTAITFGGLMSSKTNNLMGISETLLSTSFVGIMFHLLASQPLMIVGGTGPLLIFDEALYQLCAFYDFDFLTVRIYIGIWLGVIALTIAAFDGCVYLRLLTRFTQELFSFLISIIFMGEAVFKVIEVFETHPISVDNNDTTVSSPEIIFHPSDDETSNTATNAHVTNEPNTALFCTILSVGTLVLAYCLRAFRNSHFFGRSIRRAIGDFGVPLSITAFVYLSYLIPQIYTEKLIVPEGLSPTSPNVRTWIIPFNGLPIWVPFLSAIAASLVYVLIFMETQISELILDARELKKGSGFHVDIVIICLLNVVCGFLGMPWQSGATIRSVTHVSAVTTIPDGPVEPGESKKLIVKEQRVSGLIISVSVGLSVIMAPILRLVPVSILYGVFFYMGIVSISGVQFLHRIRLLFTPTKYHGTEAYVQHVPTWKMHLFTCVQIIALCVLWVVKSSRFSLALPFVLLLMIPLKQKISTYFTVTEMAALDGNLPEIDAKDEPDFYEQSHLTV